MWKEITGYRFPYRINDLGQVEKQLPNGKWVSIKSYLTKSRMVVKLWISDTCRKQVAVNALLDKYFFDGYGKKNGLVMVRKNGAKTDTAIYNIRFTTRKEASHIACKNVKRKPVVKMTKDGKVVEYYSSCTAAARANHMSLAAMCRRVNKTIKDTSRIDDFVYKLDV